MIDIVYFSNITGNTARFVEKLTIEGEKYRIPIKEEFNFSPKNPYIIVTPTYGDPNGKGMVPHQVKKFLSNPDNIPLLKGVISAGNLNFGKEFGMAGEIISHRFKIPLLHKFELQGTEEDLEKVNLGIKILDKTLTHNQQEENK
jgi:protein involved in ribonucleotide reduction